MVPRVHELSLASSAILADPSLCARYCAAQIGASATTTASCAAVAASLRAVPPVTQPPQLKPTIMQATAPTMAPHTMGLVFVGNCMANPFMAGAQPSGRRTHDRVADDQQEREKRKQDGRYKPVAHGCTSRLVLVRARGARCNTW